MPVTKAFLKPVTVEPPPQGDYRYRPLVVVLEADSAAELQALFVAEVAVQSQDTTAYYVLESVEYQVVVVKLVVGNQPAVVKYSALLHISQALKV